MLAQEMDVAKGQEKATGIGRTAPLSNASSKGFWKQVRDQSSIAQEKGWFWNHIREVYKLVW